MKAFVLSIAMVAFLAVNAMAGIIEKAEAPGEPATVNTCISGVIVDEVTGEALTGVEVNLNGCETKTYTDFDGKFVFPQVKPGDYSVEAKFISYQSVSRSIKVNVNEMHALNLKLGIVGDE
jgi:hypothetical protein